MLKIKKTKPYQFRKSHGDSARNVYTRRVACALALICGIVPSLALLSSYNVAPVSAARKTLSNITTMQEMTPEICANSALGQSNALIDTRDNSTYTVARLSDGNCWMTQNLRLTKESLETNGQSATLSSITSDVAEDSTFELPESALWTDTSVDGNHLYYDNDTDYGAYYTWYTATAGTGTAEMTSGNATSSVCPNNWRLPAKTEYDALIGKGESDWTMNGSRRGYWIGGAASATGAAFFSAAGYIDSNAGTLDVTNSIGHYWSNTPYSELTAYHLYLYDGTSPYLDNNAKMLGFSIRCLAPASSTVLPDRFDEKDVEVIAVRVAPVISIDATSGMKEEVDPNQVTSGNISATISANTTYAVQLSANKTSLTNTNDSSDTEITSSNSIPASTNVQAKTNAWGILNQDNSTYSAITTNPTTYYNTEEYNEESQATKHTFGIGVSISPTLPAGEYSTTVTITAVNN